MTDDPDAPFLAYGNDAVALPAKQALDDSVTATPAVPASASLTCPDGSKPIETWEFLPTMPSIMRAQSPPWETAATLLERWLNGPAQQLQGDPRLGKATDGGLLDIDNTVTMDWVLQFSQAREEYNELTKRDHFKVPDVMAQIVKYAKAELDRSGTNSTSFGVSQPSDDRARDANRCDSRAAGSSGLGPIDELIGALGRFTINVIPGGTVARTSIKAPGQAPQSPDDARIDITVTQASLYVRDSYDFNGNQPLGAWQKPDIINRFSRTRTFAGMNDAMLGTITFVPSYQCSGDEFEIDNAVFREFRDHTKRGRDFDVYSDLKIVTLATPVIIHTIGNQKPWSD